VRRRWLGITGVTTALPRALVRELDLVADEAVEIVDLEPNGPAAKAGAQRGDIIVAAAGRVIMTVDDLSRVITLVPEGSSFPLSIVREEGLIELLI
jgi:serine protease Do